MAAQRKRKLASFRDRKISIWPIWTSLAQPCVSFSLLNLTNGRENSKHSQNFLKPSAKTCHLRFLRSTRRSRHGLEHRTVELLAQQSLNGATPFCMFRTRSEPD